MLFIMELHVPVFAKQICSRFEVGPRQRQSRTAFVLTKVLLKLAAKWGRCCLALFARLFFREPHIPVFAKQICSCLTRSPGRGKLELLSCQLKYWKVAQVFSDIASIKGAGPSGRSQGGQLYCIFMQLVTVGVSNGRGIVAPPQLARIRPFLQYHYS